MFPVSIHNFFLEQLLGYILDKKQIVNFLLV